MRNGTGNAPFNVLQQIRAKNARLFVWGAYDRAKAPHHASYIDRYSQWLL